MKNFINPLMLRTLPNTLRLTNLGREYRLACVKHASILFKILVVLSTAKSTLGSLSENWFKKYRK
jgi:hypothetical protein